MLSYNVKGPRLGMSLHEKSGEEKREYIQETAMFRGEAGQKRLSQSQIVSWCSSQH